MKFLQTILFTCLLLGAFNLQAQVPELIRNSSFREDAQAAVDSLYNFNAIGAEKRLSEWKEKFPDHPLWSLFDAMSFWWLVLSDLENHSYDKHFLRLMKKADYAASKLLHRQRGHADALIIKAVANGYIARHFANRGEWLTSLQYARTAFKAYQYLQNVMPELPDLKLAEGLKLYYSAYLPKAYPVVKTVSWFLPDGNMKKGLKLLKQASKSAIFAGAEATYFLGNINFNYEHKYKKAVGYFRKLYESYPNNNYYSRLLVHNYYKIGKYNKALKVIEETLQRWNRRGLPFEKVLKQELFYWKGRILMRRGKFDKAADLFIETVQLAEALPRTKQRGYYTAAAYYAGQALLHKNKPEHAAQYFKAALESEAGERYQSLAESKLQQIVKN